MSFKTFSPKDAETFFLGDLDVYIDDETSPAFYTLPEKAIAFSAEFAEFLEGIPRVLVRKDLTRFGISISVTALEWTPEVFKLARGGKGVDSDANWRYLHYGTTYEEPSTHKLRFVGTLRNNKTIEFVMLKAKTEEFPEIPTGGDDYSEIPMVFAALKDTTETDETKNLAYFRWAR